jgi:hypothetical protein
VPEGRLKDFAAADPIETMPMPARQDTARDDELIRYLLGELSEEESERLDEQSVVDDGFADRLRMAEDDLVDAYARGQLAGDRRRRFEAFYLTSPRRRDRVSFARRFVASVEADAMRTGTARAAVRRLADGRWFPWAVAAAAVLCLATAGLLQQARMQTALADAQQRLAASDREVAAVSGELAIQQRAAAAAQASLAQAQAALPLAAVAIVLMPQTRGVGPVPIVAVGSASQTLPLSLGVDDPGAAPFEAELKDPRSNRIVWRSPALTPDRAITTPLVAVAVPAGPLKAQHYVIDLYTRGQDRRFVSSYAFEVVRR